MGAEAVVEAYKMGFSTGFERCKQMGQAFLPNNSIEVLRTNPLDESLKAIVDDYIGAFAKISRWLPPTTKVDVATQIKEASGKTSLHAAQDISKANNALGLK